MEDIETLLGKFKFEQEGKVPVEINKELILKQMAANGLLLEENVSKMINGRSGHKKGVIRVSPWGLDNKAKVLLGKIRYFCADFLVANNEDELSVEDELKRTDAHFRFHYFGVGSQDRDNRDKFMGIRKRTLRPLKWEISDVEKDEARVEARIEDKKYFNDRDYWLDCIGPLIQSEDNEVEIYMALFNYSCALNAGLHGTWKAYRGKDRDFAGRLERNVNGLLRMLRMNRDNLVVKRKMPLVRGREVEDLYKKIFMSPEAYELFKIKCKGARGECVEVKPFFVDY